MEFDASRPWRLNPQVALRPEPFGALAYHFGTRRLSLLKSPALRDLVADLAEYPSASEAMEAQGIGDRQRTTYESALATLAGTGMIDQCEQVAR